MRTIQLIAESLWPSCSGAPSGRTSREACLKLLAILMIVLIAGPDIFAATELTTILELFGATMFLLSFAVGFWMLGLAAFEGLRDFLLPVEQVALIKMRGEPAARIQGACLVCR